MCPRPGPAAITHPDYRNMAACRRLNSSLARSECTCAALLSSGIVNGRPAPSWPYLVTSLSQMGVFAVVLIWLFVARRLAQTLKRRELRACCAGFVPLPMYYPFVYLLGATFLAATAVWAWPGQLEAGATDASSWNHIVWKVALVAKTFFGEFVVALVITFLSRRSAGRADLRAARRIALASAAAMSAAKFLSYASAFGIGGFFRNASVRCVTDWRLTSDDVVPLACVGEWLLMGYNMLLCCVYVGVVALYACRRCGCYRRCGATASTLSSTSRRAFPARSSSLCSSSGDGPRGQHRRGHSNVDHADHLEAHRKTLGMGAGDIR